MVNGDAAVYCTYVRVRKPAYLCTSRKNRANAEREIIPRQGRDATTPDSSQLSRIRKLDRVCPRTFITLLTLRAHNNTPDNARRWKFRKTSPISAALYGHTLWKPSRHFTNPKLPLERCDLNSYKFFNFFSTSISSFLLIFLKVFS